MNTKRFNVLGKEVEAAMASAEQQVKLFSSIGGQLYRAYNLKDEIQGTELTVIISTLTWDEKQLLISSLMNKVFEVGTQIPISLNDFTGKSMELYRFLGELVEWNFNDFFTYMNSLASARKNQVEQAPQIEQAQSKES